MTTYAFFDVDGTLTSIKTMFSFQTYWVEVGKGARDEQGRAFVDEMSRLEQEGATRETMNSRYYAHFADRSVADMSVAAREWFKLVNKEAGFLFTAPVARLRSHQLNGDVAVFVSGSFPLILRPIAELLGVEDLLATELVVDHERYTGAIVGPQTIGQGKAAAIKRYLAERGADPVSCWAYGDDVSDIPMLGLVGHPVVVGEGTGLATHGSREGWEVLPIH